MNLIISLIVAALPVDSNAVSQTTGPLTVYVNADGGDDRNDCLSAGAACLTLQSAVNRLPKQIYNPVTVQLAAGSYAGAFIEGFTLHVPVDAGVDYSYLWVNGTLVPYVPDAGTSSGITTFASPTVDSTFQVLSDSTQTWVPGSLVGQFVDITGGTGCCGTVSSPTTFPIVANTATDLTVLGASITDAGSTYQLVTTGTVFTSTVTLPTTSGSPAATDVPGPGDLAYFNNQGTGFAASRLGFALGSANSRGVVTTDSRLNAFLLKMNSNSGAATGVFGPLQTPMGPPSIRQSVFQWPSGSGNIVLYGGSGGGPAMTGVNLYNSYFENGAIAVYSSSASGLLIAGCMFNGQSFASIFGQGSGINQIVGTRITNAAFGIRNTENYSVGLNFNAFGIQTTDISNSSVAAISLTDPYSSVYARTLTGTGNAIGLQISRGAKAQIGSAVTMTGTVEVSIDGTPSSWAAMRASVPPVISNPSYFTAFYQ